MADRSGGVVVVGVDDSGGGAAALRFALEEGLRRGVGVEVVTAWIWSSPFIGADAPLSLEAATADARAMQDRVVRRAMAALAVSPPVAQRVVHGEEADVLLAAAESASVLVVGHLPRRRPAHAALGSVSEECVRRSRVPVIVVPSVARRDTTDEELVGPVLRSATKTHPE